ncbi:PREDICTED: peptidyl-tRNA hydrolase, mitochondrial isoform X2 [Nelumbo nucifera]|uniref:Peptidyl-tRNA hydrolase, mitochondrial isoform X2 n=1 Tax=Nelumbo nucifera TaxID=4432 RepID=A0A1U7YWQ8_NELNU|nr:PREDICTED: peptidyl-tRNA hydrolase, mitochondrial isoform X2 [Nelumbo nucifera]
MLSRVSRHWFSTASSHPWLFVGLGNPGEKYQGTRHNVGFEMIDACAKSLGISVDTVHCKALFGQGYVGDIPIFLAKPQTYMNLSGESTGPLAAYYKMPLNRVVVFFDDMNLPCGVLRLQHKGGHEGHNGMKSVIYHFRGNREFARLRIGIGKPPGQMDPKAFLLQKFNVGARERIDSALQEGSEALKLLISKGLTESARCFNREQKYKHLRLQTLQV